MKALTLVTETMHRLLGRAVPALALPFARGIAESSGDPDALVACRLALLLDAGDWRGAFELGCRQLLSRPRQPLTRAALTRAAISAGSSDGAMDALASLVRAGRFHPIAQGLYLMAAAAGGRSVDFALAPPLAWEAGVFVTIEDCDPETIARIVAMVRPRARPDAIVGELAEVIDEVPPPLAGDGFRNDPLAAVQLAPSPGGPSDRLIVCLPGMLGRIGMPMSAFHRWAIRSGAHVLYLRDLEHFDFRHGVDILGPDFAGMATFVRELAATLSISRIATYGNSAGAIAAARLGLMVGAERVVAAAGITSGRESANLPAARSRAMESVAAAFAADVRELARAKGARTEILWIFADGHEKNRGDALGMADVPGVRLMPLPISRHNVARHLVATGTMGAVLAWATGAGALPLPETPPTWDEGPEARRIALPTGEVMLRLDRPAEPWTTAYPGPEGLVAAVDRMARENPDALAVVTPDERATFAELARLSMALAHRIGTASTAPVLMLGRADLVLVAATLACQRVGRPIVPIDPGASPLRLRQMMLSSGADVLVRRPAQLPPIESLQEDRIRTVLFDRDATPAAEIGPPVGDDALIVFTSGSTGVPKGVCHSQAALAAIVGTEIALVGIRPGDRVALVTPAFTVPGPVLGTTPAAAGATLLLLSEQATPAALVEMLERERATHLFCYVGLARAVASHARARQAFGRLRAIQIFGDVIRHEDCAALKSALPRDAEIHLLYASTEAHVVAAGTADALDALPDGRMPLGRIAPGMEAWLRLPAADSDAGEICVAGPRVTRGYWRDPRLAAEKFLPHPAEPGRTLYMMGDLVRQRPDGIVEFVGRADNQVKLRGWRIELEEIESAARTVEGVEIAAVVPRRNAQGLVDALALHVATSEAEAIIVERLRHAHAPARPAHMVPAWLLVAAALPRTPTGAVDRRRQAVVDSRRRVV
ncbi:MAG: AMP-binding protein, partial [Alphaproteobacteria bacterium]